MRTLTRDTNVVNSVQGFEINLQFLMILLLIVRNLLITEFTNRIRT